MMNYREWGQRDTIIQLKGDCVFVYQTSGNGVVLHKNIACVTRQFAR